MPDFPKQTSPKPSASAANGSTTSQAEATDWTHRVTVLETAANLITGDRAEAYGSYREQMESIAQAFNGLHSAKGDPWLEAHHISMIMMLLKLRRRVTAGDIDSSVDLCGYAALDAEHFTDPEKLKV